jgi:hypothetical protein
MFAIVGYVLYAFSWFFLNKIGLILQDEYFLQYVFYSDLLNLSIRDGALNYGIENVSSLIGCQKQIDIDKLIAMKAANTVNINGVWNIDNILNDNNFGVCKIDTPDGYEALKKYWVTDVIGNPLSYIQIRLDGFVQLFNHDTNTLMGKIGSVLYSPIWLVILIMYFIFISPNGRFEYKYYWLGVGLALYLFSLLVLAPGYDLRYCLPISLASITIILMSRGN